MEFLADAEVRQIDDSLAENTRAMLKLLRASADEFGFRYLNQFSMEELAKFCATGRDALCSGARKLERVRVGFRFARVGE